MLRKRVYKKYIIYITIKRKKLKKKKLLQKKTRKLF